MTKKDYEAIAKQISGITRDYTGRTNIDAQAMMADLSWDIANIMQDDNPRFDRGGVQS
jgi:hypothetical protein